MSRSAKIPPPWLPAPRKTGQWHVNNDGSPALCGKRPGIRGHIHLPSVWALGCKPVLLGGGRIIWELEAPPKILLPTRRSARIRVGKNARPPSKTKRGLAPMDDTEHDKKISASLRALPNELLVAILEQVLPSRRTFHFSTAGHKRIMMGVSVHQICAPDDSPSLADLHGLALTCHRLKEIAYSIFYSENSFIVELSAVPLTTKIVGDGLEIQLGYVGNDPEFGSWSRFIFMDSAPGPVIPHIMAPAIFRHIKALTLCVSIAPEADQEHNSMQPPKSLAERQDDRKQVADLLDTVVSSISQIDVRLQELDIRLSVALSRRCDDTYIYSDSGLAFHVYKSLVAGVGIGLTPPHQRKLLDSVDEYNAVLRPLSRIQGLRKVDVTGIVSREFASSLAGEMTQPVVEAQPSKKIRLV